MKIKIKIKKKKKRERVKEGKKKSRLNFTFEFLFKYLIAVHPLIQLYEISYFWIGNIKAKNQFFSVLNYSNSIILHAR